MTNVINIKSKEPYHVYCGRESVFYKLDRSIFYNPFVVGKDGTRDEVVAKFKNYFYKRLYDDNDFNYQVHQLKDKTLACWCKPLACHCDVIAEFLDGTFRKNRVIIAGSRHIANYDLVESAIQESSFKIDEVVCGCAQGVDNLGNLWADMNDIPVKRFPAKWDDFTVSPCSIKVRRNGSKYNSWAGHIRNKEMAKYGTHLILVWDGKSSGSASMKKLAHDYNLTIFEKIVK